MGRVKWREVDWCGSSYSQTMSGACGGGMHGGLVGRQCMNKKLLCKVKE